MLLTIQELSKAQCNNTDINNTDYSDTDPFLSYPEWNRSEMTTELTINIENPKKKSSIAYSCECILKIATNFAIIIHSKRERRNRR